MSQTLGHRAVGLDVDRHYVVTENGDAVPWDAVIVATGSRPRTLVTTEGEALPVLRTPADLHVLREAAARYGQVTLIGAGLIGLEVAASLSGHQVEVTLINDLELPLRNVLGAPVAEEVRELHRRHGVDLLLGVSVESVSGGPGSYSVQLSNGSTHRTSFILVGIGVEANDEWLDGSGVALDAGVLVDAAGRANIPGVWAAGDVARLLSHPSLPMSSTVATSASTSREEPRSHTPACPTSGPSSTGGGSTATAASGPTTRRCSSRAHSAMTSTWSCTAATTSSTPWCRAGAPGR